ncbi:MAG: pseudouridine synthase [Fimbriiglobus sp.]
MILCEQFTPLPLSADMAGIVYHVRMERLNKFLAHAGVGSRRHCDDLIAAGRVKINGERVADAGARVDPEKHKVSVDDAPVRGEKLVYWVVHKPPGFLCTNHDPSRRALVTELLPHVEQRVYTVGRLDESSEGLLLMTNDGELAFALMHPRYGIDKTYQVLVAGKPSKEDLDRILEGVWLSDGKARAKSVRRMKPQGDSTWLRIVLCEGKNREIRRMLAKLGHKVLRLKRVAIGPVQLDRLPKGKSRKLSLEELKELKKMVGSAEKRIEAKLKTARGEAADAETPEVVEPIAEIERPKVARPTGPRVERPRPPAPPKRSPNDRPPPARSRKMR